MTLLWRSVAPNNTARRKPRGFNGANPGDYPAQEWDPFDSLVREATARGIAVYFNPTGPGPRWAHGRREREVRPECLAAEPGRSFGSSSGRRAVATAARTGTRTTAAPSSRACPGGQSGTSPTSPAGSRPRARRSAASGMIAAAPHLYRELLIAGAKGLLRTGHADDLVLIGELAPIGSAKKAGGPRSSLRPGLFLREMFCLNGRYRPFSGREAEARGCNRLDRLGVLERFSRLGFGHHPYTRKRAPTKRERQRDMMNIGNVSALPRALDKIAARTGLLPARDADLLHRVRLPDAARPLPGHLARRSRRSTSTRASSSPGGTRASSPTRSSSSTTCRRAPSSRAARRPTGRPTSPASSPRSPRAARRWPRTRTSSSWSSGARAARRESGARPASRPTARPTRSCCRRGRPARRAGPRQATRSR